MSERCPRCYNPHLDGSEDFCTNCGTNLSGNFCSNPGCRLNTRENREPLDDNFSYCPACGKKTMYYQNGLTAPKAYTIFDI